MVGRLDQQRPSLSWGALVNKARAYLDVAWWMSAFPGAAIALTVVALNLLADALGAAVDGHS